jgi:chorismate synthase
LRAYLVELGGDRVDPAAHDDAEIDRNPFFCPDAGAAARWAEALDAARKAGDSLGAVVEVVATGVPAGWGAPLYAKLDSQIAHALMGINAVKGVEIGDGFAAARLRGTENADAMRPGADGPVFEANHAVVRREDQHWAADRGANGAEAHVLDSDAGADHRLGRECCGDRDTGAA